MYFMTMTKLRGIYVNYFAITAILLSFMANQASTFEANISTEEVRRLNNDFLLKDLAVGETMFVTQYAICAVDGKFVLSGLTGPHDPSGEYSRDDAYLKVKRLPKFEVAIEIMPPINGAPLKERDYIFDKACGEGLNWFFLELSKKELIEDPFAITTINGFTDAKSLWLSFKQVE